MFRDAQDVGMMLNFIALSSWEYGVEVLADAEMSTHVHLITIARRKQSNAKTAGEGIGLERGVASDFVSSIRKRYTAYFTGKYHRKRGIQLGEKGFFFLEVSGNCHMQTAMSYVLRNPWHHGVAGTVFEYPFSSANDMFPLHFGRTDMPRIANPNVQVVRKHRNGHWGKVSVRDCNVLKDSGIWCPPHCELITSKEEMARYLPRFAEWPDEWVMSEDHVFLRPCFEELKLAETLYVTPGSFEYAMFRRTDDRMIEEQKADANDKPPVTLYDIEPDSDKETVERFISNEKAGTFRSCPSDFEVCQAADKYILPSFACKSVYDLDYTQLQHVASILRNDLHFSVRQIERCLPFILHR